MRAHDVHHARELAAASRALLDAKLDHGEVYEYRIQRDEHGRVQRYPKWHPRSGRPVEAFGPRNHLPAARIGELEAFRTLLVAIKGIWDFDWVVW